MENLAIEIYILLFSTIAGMHIGYIHAKTSSNDDPIWPVKLYIDILKELVMSMDDLSDMNLQFSFRDHFIAATFMWVVIVFIGLIIALEALRAFN